MTGECDLSTAPELRRQLSRLAEHRWLVIDLAGVELIDSVGLGLIVGAARRARQADGHLIVVAPGVGARLAMQASRLDRILDVRSIFDASDRAPGATER